MRPARTSALSFLVVASAALLSLSARAVPAPGLEWRTLKTGCCDVHYHEGLERQARHVAAMSDEILALLEDLLDALPSERVQIVLSDVTDSPNGYATSLPYNQIHLFAVPPDADHELAHNDDWLRMLLTHEMLHVVHLDTVHGLPRLVNAVLGKQWPPNFVLPSWAIEGIATYAETVLTTGGRLRSARWRGYLRLAALEGDLWSLDDAVNHSRRAPSGNASRLYGGHFLWWLAIAKGGDEYLARFNHDYASRPIPYALQRSLAESADVDLTAAWKAFLDDVRAEASARLRVIEARGGPTSARRLTRLGGTVESPRFQSDGTLVFVSNPPNGPSGLYAIAGLPSAVPEPVALAQMNGAASAAPAAGGTFVVTMAEWWWSWWQLRDLWHLVPGRPPVRLSDGARFRSPAAFPDGRRVVVEERSGSRSALVLVDVATGEREALATFEDGTLAYTPEPSPDGAYVVYARVEAGGARSLVELDVKTRAERVLLRDGAENLDPTYTPDGRHVVFSSDRDGALNLYALSRGDGRVQRVTDVLGSATHPVVTPDGSAVVFVGQTLEGDDLYVAPLVLAGAALAPDAPDASLRSWRPPLAVDQPSVAYNPLPTLRPYNWLPTLADDATGAPAVGVVVEGGDVVGQYGWALQASYGFGTERPRVAATFSFRDLFVPLTLAADQRTSFSSSGRRDVFGEPEEQVEQVYRVGASATLPVRRWLRSHSFSVGYSRAWHLVETKFSGPPDEGVPVFPPSSDLGWLSLGWRYSDDERYRDSVSAERGFELYARARISNQYTLSALDLYEFTTGASAFHPVPTLPRHALAVYVEGGVAFGNRFRRASFRVGGFPERDLVRDVLEGVRWGGGQLRGYGFNDDVGDGYVLSTLEYRFPIWEIEHGVESLPLWVGRLHGAFFGDLGDAFDGVPRPSQLRAGVGAELRLTILLGYYGSYLIRAGYARGLMPGGVDQPYVVLGFPY